MAREAPVQSDRSPVRMLLFLALALGTGVVLIVVLFQLITGYQRRIEEAKRPEDQVMVIVANKELYPGVTVAEEDLYAVEIPPRYLPDGVFLSPDHVVGRIPRERILANEFIRADRLADPESGVGLNAVIPRGMRAISVEVSGGHALAGFLNPGNYVDVIVTIKPDASVESTEPDAKGAAETKTFLQAVFVLGVNSRMQREDATQAKEKRGKASPSVTLLVNAEQAEQVAHFDERGDLTLTLRNDQDVEETALQASGVNVEDLRAILAGPEKVEKARMIKRTKVVAPAPVPDTLIIIKGSKRTEQQMDQNGVIQQPAGGRN
ncbi:MAG: Flp pilus assembly protein CpaB [Deltaproteobacteria bacterium]|nr:Flp pilus assembly protein CpaB [Deltaproteobacteria bacterium]